MSVLADVDNGKTENKLIAERRAKLARLRESGNAFPNDFRRNALAGQLLQAYGEYDDEKLEQAAVRVQVAGRMRVKRVMGKASFIKVADQSGQIQVFVQRDSLGTERYSDFKSWDVGDIVAADGTLFRTNRGELSVRADDVRILAKALRPLPEKWHGLSDQETRYRQRYVDLIINDASREVFVRRSAIVRHIRSFLDAQGFLEVETPMMQIIPGGAVARPFVTHHNALDIDLYLRIAPELYLKRLIVGGFDRVYEINRNFRNEGVSTQHNPEFTMLELYRAFADYRDLIDMLEAMLKGLAESLLGTRVVHYQGHDFDFGAPFRRVSVADAVLAADDAIDPDRIRDLAYLRGVAEAKSIDIKASYGPGKIQIELFEALVEKSLLQPTFVTHYPAEVSPLSRCSDQDPFVTDRFELFIARARARQRILGTQRSGGTGPTLPGPGRRSRRR